MNDNNGFHPYRVLYIVNFLDSAFAQLAFAAKLLEYVEQGKLNVDELDQPLRIEEGSSIWVLPDRLFHSDNDLHLACANQLSVAFGAAAITLNRCREEFEAANQVSLLARNGNPPISEDEHFAELVYQIRNAFAHDISEPHWEIRGEGRRRPYPCRLGECLIALTSQLCDASSSRGTFPWMRSRARASGPPFSIRVLYLLTVGRLSRACLDTSLMPSPFNRSSAARTLRRASGTSSMRLLIVIFGSALAVISLWH